MLKLLLSIKKAMTRSLELAVILLVTALVLDVLWGVFSRYVLGAQSRWTEELATTLLIWVSLLGASVACGSKSHLGVDYFTQKLDPRAKATMEVPSPQAGRIKEVKLSVGDEVSKGDLVAVLEVSGAADANSSTPQGSEQPAAEKPATVSGEATCH